VLELRKHIVKELRHLYSIAFEKGECARAKNGQQGELCDWCSTNPRRCSYSLHGSLLDNVKCAPGGCSDGDLCEHAVNRQLIEVVQQIQAVTPADYKVVRLCGYCREPRHNIRTCPKKPRSADANAVQDGADAAPPNAAASNGEQSDDDDDEEDDGDDHDGCGEEENEEDAAEDDAER